MTKINELKNLLAQMQNITADEEYLKQVGFQSEWDNEIVNAISELYETLNSRDEKYYIYK